MKSPILKLAEQVAALPKEQQSALVTIADTLRESGASAPRRGRPKASKKAVVKDRVKPSKKSKGDPDVDRLLSKAK